MTSDVNPARAGMIPGQHPQQGRRSREPRASGDDPNPVNIYIDEFQ